MRDKCIKCNKENTQWVSGEKFEGLEEHHNPPRYMFENRKRWEGEIFTLCDECHEKLHQEVIIPFLNVVAGTLKKNGSEHWLWNKLILEYKRENTKEQVINMTRRFVHDTNTTTT